jgi:serine/threonine-protein phosphatase 6 regulatory ankyrin repeat subunit A
LGYEECCVFLINNNASPHIRDINGLLPLHYVVIAGHAQILPLFLEYKYDTLLDSYGYTLLHYACFNGHSTCAEILCENELILSTCDQLIKLNKFTVLHAAAYNGQETCLNYLIQTFQSKYDNLVESKDHFGRTALHICASNDDTECGNVLIQANCNLNSFNNNNDTPLMSAISNNSLNMVEILIENGADLKLVNKEKNTVLHLAFINGHEASARYILDKINDSKFINLINNNGDTALHLAAANGFSNCVENLLNKGANIWIKNLKSHSPLLSCAKNDSVAECLDIMLTKFIHTIQAYDTSNSSLFTSSTVILNNDVNMFNNINNSTNYDILLQQQQQQSKLNDLNTTCTLNQIG